MSTTLATTVDHTTTELSKTTDSVTYVLPILDMCPFKSRDASLLLGIRFRDGAVLIF